MHVFGFDPLIFFLLRRLIERHKAITVTSKVQSSENVLECPAAPSSAC